MVTRQSSPSFFLRYQALISPPGPPPTIARSNMVFRDLRPPRSGTRGLTHPSKSAFFSEGKMNKRSSNATVAKKSEKKAGLRRPFFLTPLIRAALFRPPQRHAFDFRSRRYNRHLL